MMMKMLPEGLAMEEDVVQEKKKGKMVAGGAAAQLRRPMASHALVREGRSLNAKQVTAVDFKTPTIPPSRTWLMGAQALGQGRSRSAP